MRKVEKNKEQADVIVECGGCKSLIVKKELIESFMICPKCNYYVQMSAAERIEMLIDKDTFTERDGGLTSQDILNFPDYTEKLQSSQEISGLKEAVVCGECKIGGFKVELCILDFSFMGGSMGSVVGEKVTRAVERAIKKKLPLIIVSASGGARMQEGIFSLMQMAKSSAAIARLKEKKLPYISLLTHPTTGGVSASFAMLGDLIIAEPKALIGFAGPRVIEQTIREKLPQGFQLSEFLLEHGLIDAVIERKNLKEAIIRLLRFFKKTD